MLSGEQNRKTTTETVSITTHGSAPRRSRLDRDDLERTVFVQTSNQRVGFLTGLSPFRVSFFFVPPSFCFLPRKVVSLGFLGLWDSGVWSGCCEVLSFRIVRV